MRLKRVPWVRLVAALAVVLLTLLIASGGCTRLAPTGFDKSRPLFDPLDYFSGALHSYGVIETRRGEPRQTFVGSLQGDRSGATLQITQDFVFDDGRTKRRRWQIQQLDAHHFSATADDIIGTAHGTVYGRACRLSYILETKPGNPLSRVRMKHWMYLADDGQTLINRVTITKLGLIVGGTTEYFQPRPSPEAG